MTQTQTVIKNPVWWHRRTTRERRLVVVQIVALLAAIALATTLIVLVTGQQHQAESAETSGFLSASEIEPEICLTPGCLHAASQVLSKMDATVDPCDDFYQYACGNYLRTVNIPDDHQQVDSMSALSDQLMEKLRNAMEEEEDPRVVPRNLQLARELYNGCINKKRIEARDVAPLKNVLKEVGGWPAVEGDSWDEESFSWLQSVYSFRRAGLKDDLFIELLVYNDFKNNTKYTLYLDEPSLGINGEFLLKGLSDKLVRAYYEYQVDMAVMLGADRARAERDLKDSLDFHIALTKIIPSKQSRRKWTDMYNPFTVEQMQQKYPSVPWLEFLQMQMPPNITISTDDVVIVMVPNFLKDLEALLNRTAKRTLANYAMWRVVDDLVPFMNVEMRERQLAYLFALTGKRERQFRWKECLETVSNRLDLSTGSMYLRKFFNKESKKELVEMLDNVRREFLNILQEAEWMDNDATRKKAVEKVQSMGAFMGYRDELLDDTKLDHFYEKLELNASMYLESQLNLTRFLFDFFYGCLRKTTEEREWITHGKVTTVNVFYNLVENLMVFPAGVLQEAFFSADRPKYMNYGAIGYLMGYLMTHGFGDEGRLFGKKGELGDWWDPVTREKFLKRAECIISQAGNYTDEQTGLRVNGQNTLSFNMASNGAIKEAYRAYLALERRSAEPEPRLPTLDHLSPRQMYWLSFAQTWCSKYRTERMRQRITSEVIPPDRFRVMSSLANRPEFAEDFGCPSGSRMNPVDKCQVW